MMSPWTILTGSFVLALSGALMPGPILTYTIITTAQAGKFGFLVGPRVVAGHAVMETAVMLALVLGVTELLNSPPVIKVIGVLGGLLLVYMGIGLIREVFIATRRGLPMSGDGSFVSRLRPFLAGILLSVSNPYWWVWWVMAGSATLLAFGVTLRAWKGLLAFFLGHMAGDLAWYALISLLVHFGKGVLTQGFYRGLLLICGVALIGLAAFLGISPFFRF
jgi:threonine/homoserine/homoserine lactone efflux protein